MPKWLRRVFFSRDMRFHFRLALGLGLLARLASAWFVYGPQALDDYKHGVWPAYQLFAGLPVELPEYRSHLLVFTLALFVKIASWLDVTSALGQVRAMYAGLGLISLLGIVGTYVFARDWRSRVFAAAAVYLAALFPLMPFVGTRAFGEAVAMSLVTFAFGLTESARRRGERGSVIQWIAGFLALGLATLFRFHIGLIYVSYMLILFGLKAGRGFMGALVAGFLTVIAQATVDALSGKVPMSTLFIYLRENEGGGAKYGVSPWYNPLLFVLAVALVPFSAPIWRRLKPFWRREWPMLVPFLIFLLAHCLVAHKEERFLYPLLGVELWLVAYAWAASARDRWARRIFAPVLLAVTALLLPVVCFVNTQEGEIEPPALIGSEYDAVVYLDDASLFGASRFQFYFLRPPSLLVPAKAEELTKARVDEELTKNPKHQAVALLTSDPASRPSLEAMHRARTPLARCGELQTSGSLVDRLLYRLNPKHNQRRRPTWYVVCERR